MQIKANQGVNLVQVKQMRGEDGIRKGLAKGKKLSDSCRRIENYYQRNRSPNVVNRTKNDSFAKQGNQGGKIGVS